MVPDNNRRLSTGLECRDKAVGDLRRTKSRDCALGAAGGGDLRNQLFQKVVPSYWGLQNLVQDKLKQLQCVGSGKAFTVRSGVNQAAWAEKAEIGLCILVQNLFLVCLCVQMGGVVGCVNGDRDSVILTEDVALFEESFGGRRRAADCQGHDADSADVCLIRGRNAIRGMEIGERGFCGVFVDFGDDSGPGILRVRCSVKRILGTADDGSCPE